MKVKYAAAAETRRSCDVAVCDGELNFKFIRKQRPMNDAKDLNLNISDLESIFM